MVYEGGVTPGRVRDLEDRLRDYIKLHRAEADRLSGVEKDEKSDYFNRDHVIFLHILLERTSFFATAALAAKLSDPKNLAKYRGLYDLCIDYFIKREKFNVEFIPKSENLVEVRMWLPEEFSHRQAYFNNIYDAINKIKTRVPAFLPKEGTALNFNGLKAYIQEFTSQCNPKILESLVSDFNTFIEWVKKHQAEEISALENKIKLTKAELEMARLELSIKKGDRAEQKKEKIRAEVGYLLELIGQLKQLGIAPPVSDKDVLSEESKQVLDKYREFLEKPLRERSQSLAAVIGLRENLERLRSRAEEMGVLDSAYTGPSSYKDVIDSWLDFLNSRGERTLAELNAIQDVARDIELSFAQIVKQREHTDLFGKRTLELAAVLGSIRDGHTYVPTSYAFATRRLLQQVETADLKKLELIQEELFKIWSDLNKIKDIWRSYIAIFNKLEDTNIPSDIKSFIDEKVSSHPFVKGIKVFINIGKLDRPKRMLDKIAELLILIKSLHGSFEIGAVRELYGLIENDKITEYATRIGKIVENAGSDPRLAEINEMKIELNIQTWSNKKVLERLRALYSNLGETTSAGIYSAVEALIRKGKIPAVDSHKLASAIVALREMGIDADYERRSITPEGGVRLEKLMALAELIKEVEK